MSGAAIVTEQRLVHLTRWRRVWPHGGGRRDGSAGEGSAVRGASGGTVGRHPGPQMHAYDAYRAQVASSPPAPPPPADDTLLTRQNDPPAGQSPPGAQDATGARAGGGS